MTTQLEEQPSTKEGHAPYHPAVVNAFARALGRLELTDLWIGADHDMPGTSQAEREASRWAAKQFLDELQKELAPAGEAATAGGSEHPRYEAGPFKSLRDTTPEEEQLEYWVDPNRAELRMMSDRYAKLLAQETYQTHAWDLQGEVLTDAELSEYLFNTEFDHKEWD